MRLYLPGFLLLIHLELFSVWGTCYSADGNTFRQHPNSRVVSSLPVIKIHTEKRIQDKKKVDAGIEIIHDYGNRDYETDSLNNYRGPVKIEVRGSSSEAFPKKSFSIQTVDDTGELKYVSLLGLPSECDWILYAPYNDKSLMRDVIAYRIARDLNRYATQTIFVELYLNEQYQGVYILEEKIKRHPGKASTIATSTNEGITSFESSRYILRIDRTHDAKWFIDKPTLLRIIRKTKTILLNKKAAPPNDIIEESACTPGKRNYFKSVYAPVDSKWQLIKFSYYDPQPEELTLEDRIHICEFVHDMESSLLESFTTDKDYGYHRFIDMESFVDYFIINEVTKNMDAYRLSTYFYLSGEKNQERLYMGPPWDFNISMGNANYCGGDLPKGWAYKFNGICSNDAWLVPFWWERLMQDPVFRDHLKCRWVALRKNSLSTNHLMNVIDSISGSLKDAPYHNFKRWNILGKNVWPNKYVFKTYQEEIIFLKRWLNERLEWLDMNMPGDCSHPNTKR